MTRACHGVKEPLPTLALSVRSFSKVKRRGESNTDKSLRRMMQPRSDGSYLLPKEVVDEYKDIAGGGRERVLKMWASTSHDKVGLCVTIVSLHGLGHVSHCGF